MQNTRKAKLAWLISMLFFLGICLAPRALGYGTPPVITVQPTNTTVLLLGTTTFSVTVSSSTTLTYQWMKDGHNISGATSATYSILNASASDAGTYSVKVRNGGGSVTSSNATLTVSVGINVDSTSSSVSSSAGATSLAWQHSVSGNSGTLLLVNVATLNGVSVSSVTYGGVGLSHLGSAVNSTGPGAISDLWYLKNPTPGTANIVVTLSGKATVTAGATTLSGVDQTAPFGTFVSATGSGDVPSINVASAANQLVIDFVAAHAAKTGTTGAGQTTIWSQFTGTGSGDVWGSSSSELGASSVNLSWSLSGSGAGEWAQAAISMKASGPAPAISTMAASDLTMASATLNASLNPQGTTMGCFFQYGLSTDYEYVTSTNTVPATTNGAVVGLPISGLTPGTVYHYRSFATYPGGCASGQDATFTTAFPHPAAATFDASSVSSASALFNGGINAKGAPAAYFFRYGTTTDYGSFSPTNLVAAVNGPVSISVPQNGLAAGTLYHCQAVVVTSGGVAVGQDVSFTTIPSAPSGSDLSASSVTPTSAVLNGKATQQLVSLTCYFQYGTDTSYGHVSSSVLLPGLLVLGGILPVNIPISGLTPGTIYHYRLVVNGLSGATYGPDASFVTGVVSSNLVVASIPQAFSPSSGFTCELAVPPGVTYVVEATSDFAHWTPVWTNISTTASAIFNDPAAVNFKQRVYRVVVKQ